MKNILEAIRKNRQQKIDECAEEKQLYTQTLSKEGLDLEALKALVEKFGGTFEEVEGEVIVKVPHLSVLEFQKSLDESCKKDKEVVENTDVEEVGDESVKELEDKKIEDETEKAPIEEDVKNKGRKSLKIKSENVLEDDINVVDEGTVEYDLPLNESGEVDKEYTEKLVKLLSDCEGLKVEILEDEGAIQIKFPKSEEEKFQEIIPKVLDECGLEVEDYSETEENPEVEGEENKEEATDKE